MHAVTESYSSNTLSKLTKDVTSIFWKEPPRFQNQRFIESSDSSKRNGSAYMDMAEEPVIAASISLDLDYKIGKVFSAIEQNLVGRLRRNPDHIARRELHSGPTFYSSIALLVRFGNLSSNHVSANQKGRGTGFDKEDIGLSLMPLDNAVSFTNGQHEKIIRIVLQLASGHRVRLRRRFRFERLPELFQLGSRPVLESLRRGGLRKHGQWQHENNRRQQAKLFHGSPRCGHVCNFVSRQAYRNPSASRKKA